MSYSSLLPFIGENNSTTFTDSTGKVWTPAGNAKLVTAEYKYPPSSMYLDGTGDYIDTPDHVDFTVGSGDWTIGYWIKRGNDYTTGYIFKQAPSDGAAANTSLGSYLTDGNAIAIFGFTSGTIKQVISSANSFSSAMGWKYIEHVRSGNTLYNFIHGTLDGTLDITGVTFNDSTAKFTIGSNGEEHSNFGNFWMGEFVFIKGEALHTANFTPPTSRYMLPSGVSAVYLSDYGVM